MARPAGLEPATLGLEGRCSIQLSYGRKRTPQPLVLPLPRQDCALSIHGRRPSGQLRCPKLLPATLVEPATLGLEGRCSIQLSYGRKPVTSERRTADGEYELFTDRRPLSAAHRTWSGQRDSNPRPSAPKADALPDCAMPRRDQLSAPLSRGSPARTGRRIIRTRSPSVNFQLVPVLMRDSQGRKRRLP